MIGRRFRLVGLLTMLVLVGTVASTGSSEQTAIAAEAQPEPMQPVALTLPPRPLPHDCDGVTPPGGSPPACCAYGYIYYDDAPVAGARVDIESPRGTNTVTTTVGSGLSNDPYYSVDLSSSPLRVSPGDVITITASYSDMVSIRIWTVQSDGQHVDLGLISGYQASEPISALTNEPLGPAALQASEWWTTVRKDIRQSEYHVTWQDHTRLPGLSAAYQAPNRAHNLRTYFTLEGPMVIPRIWPKGTEPSPWRWGLTLTGYGHEGYIQPVSAAELTASAKRIEYRREGLTEWYVNDERGLEQGFTMAAAPKSQIPDSESLVVLEFVLSGDLTPHLSDDGEAIEFTTSDGVQVLRYGDLHAIDAIGRALPAHLQLVSSTYATGNTFYAVRITLDATIAVYPITIDSLTTTPNWTAESDQISAEFGYSVGTAGDVNSDGYTDVIGGAHYYDNGQTKEGQAYVYPGSTAGLSTVADWTAESNQHGARFGTSVGTAGDVNSDGYDDVIVAALLYDNGEGDEGRAFVYHGSATGLSTTANWTAESNQANAYLGSASTAGDVNGDGYDDVIVGACYYDHSQIDEGAAYVYHGSASGLTTSPNWTAESDQGGALFGILGTAGDVNGDGYDDIIVGAPNYDGGQRNEGRAYVYHGSATGLSASPDWTAESDQVDAGFGRSVSTAGDVNGDGYDDVIVGTYRYDGGQTNEGRAYVYHGSASGLSTSPNWTAESDQGEAFFGTSVDTAGDVNGDGYDDVIVGAHGYDNGETNEGRAFVYYGSVTGLGVTADWTAESDQDGGEFGWSVGSAGDVNGDGYGDVIVGAVDYDNGQPYEGRGFIYHGSATGLSTTAYWMAEGNQDGAEFGNSVGTAGDVNGDGCDDIIVGSPYYDNGQIDEGQAFVYYGPIVGPAATIPAVASAQAGSDTWIRVSSPFSGDINGNSYTVYKYSLSEDGSWTQGCGNGTPGESGWRQCEFRDLAPDTNYYVRVAFVDPDGVVGTNPQILGPIRTHASSVNAVTVDTATVTILDTHLLVSVPISEDSNRDSQLQDVQVAPSDSGPWTQKCGPYPPSYAYAPKLCRIHGLTRDTNYWVRVTVSDPDGVNGPNPQLIGPIHYTGLANLALGKAITADPGWGCCPDPGQLVDGRIQNPDWNYGFAWTGGTGNWGGGSPGWKQATVDLGSSQQVSRVDLWPHNGFSVPTTWQVLASHDGITYAEVFTTTEFRCRTATQTLEVSWLFPSCRHSASLDEVTARYVRYRFDDRTLLEGYHGWAVEIETFGGDLASDAAFVASPISGTAPLTVTFTDQSSGDITSWSWEFGDGGTSTDQNPTYTFTSPGTYTVSLTVGGPSGSDTETKADYITVDYPAPNAAFTASPLSGPIPLDVQFNDQSVGSIISWDWTYGDGNTSGARHPSHTYEDADIYTVSLTISGPGGSDTETKPDYIAVTTDNETWTFALYFAGDNNLHPYLERAIDQVERVANNPNLNILVLWDSWQDGDTRLYHVEHDMAPGIASPIISVGWNSGELNTGITQTLVSFVDWARTYYPADHYFLSIANHGRGTTGIAWDHTNDEDYLSAYPELGSALSSITGGGSNKIDVLYLDACLMGMIEDAYEVKESVEYLVASENLGWSVFVYDAYVSSVTGDTTPRQLAQNVADAYIAALQGYPATVSALDLSAIESLGSETDELAQALEMYLDSTNITQTVNIRNKVQTFDSHDYQILDNTDEYVDLYHFAGLVNDDINNAKVQSAAQNVMNAVADCIVTEHHQSGRDPWSGNYWDLDNAHGIAVYFPPQNDGWDYADYVTGSSWAFCNATAWDDFLVSYFSLITTEPDAPVDPGTPPMLPIERVFLPLVIRVY